MEGEIIDGLTGEVVTQTGSTETDSEQLSHRDLCLRLAEYHTNEHENLQNRQDDKAFLMEHGVDPQWVDPTETYNSNLFGGQVAAKYLVDQFSKDYITSVQVTDPSKVDYGPSHSNAQRQRMAKIKDAMTLARNHSTLFSSMFKLDETPDKSLQSIYNLHSDVKGLEGLLRNSDAQGSIKQAVINSR